MITVYYPEDFGTGGKRRLYDEKGCALALGFFDGVHLAHRELIGEAISLAKKKSLLSAVFTFPAENERIKASAKRIYSTSQKLSIFESLGIDICFVVDFSSVASLSPDEFINDIIIGAFSAKEVVCGYNFKFGKGAAADAEYLRKKLPKLNIGCTVIDECTLDGAPLSSTLIREFLENGETEKAAKALGMPYFIEGEVSHGDGRGASLGIPTANIALPHDSISLRRGVYACAAYIDGIRYPAITNIGSCPTFGERETHSESYIFGLSGDIYKKKIRIYLLGFIRDEKQFGSKEELILQITVDKKHVMAIYTETIWQEIGLN